MKLHLDLQPVPPPFRISHGSKILLLGSCFSGEIGRKLQDGRFTVLSNPGGVMFSPGCIHDFLLRVIDNRQPDHSHFIQQDGLWHSHQYRLHGAGSEQELHDAILAVHQRTLDFLSTADVCFFTFGTAFRYFHNNLGPVVNNLRQPSELFRKELMPVQQIGDQYKLLMEKIRLMNSKCRFVYTVSPVRHLRDGAIGNNISKASLLMAVAQLCLQGHYYFPSYELVIDDLRDYRFFREDMAHPNELAVAYVWEKFRDAFFTAETREIAALAESVNTLRAHRPRNSNSTSAISDRIAALEKRVEEALARSSR